MLGAGNGSAKVVSNVGDDRLLAKGDCRVAIRKGILPMSVTAIHEALFSFDER